MVDVHRRAPPTPPPAPPTLRSDSAGSQSLAPPAQEGAFGAIARVGRTIDSGIRDTANLIVQGVTLGTYTADDLAGYASAKTGLRAGTDSANGSIAQNQERQRAETAKRDAEIPVAQRVMGATVGVAGTVAVAVGAVATGTALAGGGAIAAGTETVAGGTALLAGGEGLGTGAALLAGAEGAGTGTALMTGGAGTGISLAAAGESSALVASRLTLNLARSAPAAASRLAPLAAGALVTTAAVIHATPTADASAPPLSHDSPHTPGAEAQHHAERHHHHGAHHHHGTHHHRHAASARSRNSLRSETARQPAGEGRHVDRRGPMAGDDTASRNPDALAQAAAANIKSGKSPTTHATNAYGVEVKASEIKKPETQTPSAAKAGPSQVVAKYPAPGLMGGGG